MRARRARAHDLGGSSTDIAEEITMNTVTLLETFEGGIR
jgi:hypothetical protein